MHFRIGIDVGGTNVRFGVFDELSLCQEIRINADFSILCQQYPSAEAQEKIVTMLAEQVTKIQKQYLNIASIGIGFPGFVDPISQKVLMSPNLPGLKDVDLNLALFALTGVPVKTENDALVAAYGEYHLLKATNPTISNLIYLGLGTGVGGGLILNGKPYSGVNGVAMEIGHLIIVPQGRLCGCGNMGCMERYASASGISATYYQACGVEKSAAAIAEMAAQGDRNAVEAYQIAGQSLAFALAHILKIVDVRDVVIGGGVSAGWQWLQEPFTTQLNQMLIPVLKNKINIQISSAGDIAGMLGASML